MLLDSQNFTTYDIQIANTCKSIIFCFDLGTNNFNTITLGRIQLVIVAQHNMVNNGCCHVFCMYYIQMANSCQESLRAFTF